VRFQNKKNLQKRIMPPKKLSGARRERKDPTQELISLASKLKKTDEELQPLVRQALEDGANVNAMIVKAKSFQTVLHAFIVQGKVLCVETLLERKPNLDLRDHYGNVPLTTVMLNYIPEPIRTKLVQLLVGAGADIESPSLSGTELVRQVVKNGCLRALGKFPAENNNNVNTEQPKSDFE
jgi:hypothetical protein